MMTLTNLGPVIDGWKFNIDVPFTITSLYNFEYNDSLKEVSHKDWNKTFTTNQIRDSGFSYTGTFPQEINFIADGSNVNPIPEPQPAPTPIPQPQPQPQPGADEVCWKNIPYIYKTNPKVFMWTSEHWA